MNQLEAILIAKTIRNMVDAPLGYKNEFMRAFLPLLRERVPFFDEKRFVNVASETFTEGWPNRMDKK